MTAVSTMMACHILVELRSPASQLDHSHYAILHHITHLYMVTLREPTANQIQARHTQLTWYLIISHLLLV